MLNETTIKQFLEFYYNAINSKSPALLVPHLKEHTTFVRNKTHFKGGNNIVNLLSILHTNVSIIPKDMDVLLNGHRRANIMISGMCDDKPFTEFIHFAFGNDKQYWIQSSILHIVN